MAALRAARSVPLVLATALVVTEGTALAQGDAAAYPSQTITIVVPYAAGGPPDVISRIISPPLAERLGKPVVIENRAGASTAVGTASVARAAADGHTLLMVDPALTVTPAIIAKAGYDPLKDFAPVVPLMRSFMTLVVNPLVPARTAPELVALAKRKPGDIKYGSSGIGTPPYLGALAFIQATGVEMVHVPYRGVALALNDVVGGHISMVFVSQGTASAQVKGGFARVLGVYGETRLASLPDVPTFRESGIDTRLADQGTWFGVAAPAATPAPIIAKLNAAINQVLAEPATKARLEAIDFIVTGGTPDQLGKLIDQHTSYWRDALAKAGVKPE